jgi:hypothetical protein
MLLRHKSRAEMVRFSKHAAIAQTRVARVLTQHSLESIGSIKSREPQRFYSYALLDSKDKPYACFRYHCLDHGMYKILLS